MKIKVTANVKRSPSTRVRFHSSLEVEYTRLEPSKHSEMSRHFQAFSWPDINGQVQSVKQVIKQARHAIYYNHSL